MATERIDILTTPATSRFVNKAVKARAKEKVKRRRLVLLIVLLSAAVLWPIVAWAGAHLLIVKSDLAAQLYREGRAPIIILTNDSLIAGWDRKEERNPYFYELAARALKQRGVPASKIQVVSDIALGTYEESLGVRDY